MKAAGLDVAILDIQETNLGRFEVLPGRGRVTGYLCDVTDGASVRAACADVLEQTPRVSVLINNAGGSGSVRVEKVEDHTDAIWAHVGDLNLTSIIRFSRAFVPGMRAQRFGRIINISSAARHGMQRPGATINSHLGYVTFKAAMTSLTRQLANDLGPDQITVNTIAPGLIFAASDARIAKIVKAQGDATLAAFVETIPLRRVGTADDIASLANFLASEAAGYISGQTIDVNGGLL